MMRKRDIMLSNKKISDLVRHGKFAEAVVSANDCISKLGDSALLYYCRGMARLQSSKLNEAEADFTKAFDCKDATDALKIDILINRGATRKLNNQHAAALTDYDDVQKRLAADKSKSKFSRTAIVLMNRGQLFDKMGRFDDSAKCYTDFLALKESPIGLRATALNNRGLAYFELKNFAQSLSDFNDAIRSEPQNGLFYFNRSLCHEAMRQPSFAIADCQKALDLDPTELIYSDRLVKLQGGGVVKLLDEHRKRHHRRRKHNNNNNDDDDDNNNNNENETNDENDTANNVKKSPKATTAAISTPTKKAKSMKTRTSTTTTTTTTTKHTDDDSDDNSSTPLLDEDDKKAKKKR